MLFVNVRSVTKNGVALALVPLYFWWNAAIAQVCNDGDYYVQYYDSLDLKYVTEEDCVRGGTIDYAWSSSQRGVYHWHCRQLDYVGYAAV